MRNQLAAHYGWSVSGSGGRSSISTPIAAIYHRLLQRLPVTHARLMTEKQDITREVLKR